MYTAQVNHLVDDKMHASSTGSTPGKHSKPVGGKAQFGSRRFGEMGKCGPWKHTAPATPWQEMLTVKSDDVERPDQDVRNRGRDHAWRPACRVLTVLIKEIARLGVIDTELESE